MAVPVKIYTTSYCGYCRMAKALLTSRKIAFEEVDVTSDEEARDWLVQETGRRTVPQIFIGEESIGGYQELAALDANGELATWLRDDA
ncbi:MAG: glutaredoxin 3 [Candidatus Binatia bacterium]